MSASPTCARCQSPLAPTDVRCLVCGLFTSDEPLTPSRSIAILRCGACGAAVSLGVGDAAKCSFCRSPLRSEETTKDSSEAEYFVPFRVDDTQARAALAAWYGTPRALPAGVDLRPVWWVGWLFDAHVLASWAVNRGDMYRIESRTGQTAMEFRGLVVPASRGVSAAEGIALIAQLDLSTSSPTPIGPEGAAIERFTHGRFFGLRFLKRALEAAARAQVLAGAPEANGHWKPRVTTLPTRLESRRFAFPAYVATVERYGRKWRAILHGQNAACIVGDRPSLARVIGRVLLIIVLVLLAVATSLVRFL